MDDSVNYITASKPTEIAKRFSSFLGVLIVAAVIYWLIIAVATFAFTEPHIGRDNAKIVGLVLATLLVVVGMTLYVRYICVSLSRARLRVDSDSFSVAAMQKFRVNEFTFSLEATRKVVFGQPLSTMEVLFDRLYQLGVPRASQVMAKELATGKLVVIDTNGVQTTFQFLDKAFSESDLLRFFEALSDKGVALEAGT